MVLARINMTEPTPTPAATTPPITTPLVQPTSMRKRWGMMSLYVVSMIGVGVPHPVGRHLREVTQPARRGPQPIGQAARRFLGLAGSSCMLLFFYRPHLHLGTFGQRLRVIEQDFAVFDDANAAWPLANE